MEIKDLQGKLVAVLGFGAKEGRATAEYLLKHGITPVLFDQKPFNQWPQEDQTYIKSLGVNFIFGADYLVELKGFDVLFRSPGVPIAKIKELGLQTEITSQTKWFFEHCPAKIIGVTGTKGKGTTSSLIYEMLQHHATSHKLKAKSFLTGNIGKIQPLEFMDELTENDWVVYELSSFQLQDLDRSPHIGVVLMVTQEHLDYHKDVEEYVTAKEPIVKFQKTSDFAIVNADFPRSMKIGEMGNGQKYYFSRKREVERGCFVKDEQIIVRNVENGSPRLRTDEAGRGRSLQEQVIVKTPDLQLRGEHNYENVCAAVSASILAGADIESIQTTLKKFHGLEHRLQFVAEKDGIKFYNDSFSTTPETAIAAIQSFSEPEIVILGGSSKNSDFTELGQIVATRPNIKAIILIGQEALKINTSIASAGGTQAKILEGAQSMAEIFNQIRLVATSGDVVLLSPACASFGMFANYKDRGEQFMAAVKNWH